MKITPLKLAGSFEITYEPRGDERGHFMRWYDRSAFAAAGLPVDWVQGNESGSKRNVVRGMHFQRPPHSETKLVRALTGAIWDAFVDLRRGSPTYGQWDAVELSSQRKNAVLVPKGFAHGFCALTDDALVGYLVDYPYTPGAEGGLAWDDPKLAIAWPVTGPALVSPKDRGWPKLSELEPLG